MLDAAEPCEQETAFDPTMWLGKDADRRGFIESMGLSPQWVTDELEWLQSDIDVWLSGQSPEEVEIDSFIGHVHLVFKAESDFVVDTVCSYIPLPDTISVLTPTWDRDVPRMTALDTTFPARFHQKAMLDARKALGEIGIEAHVLSLDFDRYRRWCGWRKDTREARFRWARACGEVITE